MNDIFAPTVDPIIASGLRSEPSIGDDGELVQRAAILQIIRFLPESVSYLESLWDKRDRDFAEKRGTKFEKTAIEIPSADNFYTGPRPSLIESSVDFWPSITCRCNSVKPSQETQLDQIDIVDLDLYIEVLCKAGPVPQNELHSLNGIETDGAAGAQGDRLTAAVQGCISADKTLGGVVQRIARPPTIKPSKPFARPEKKNGSGDYYVFYGKQVNYIVTKHQI